MIKRNTMPIFVGGYIDDPIIRSYSETVNSDPDTYVVLGPDQFIEKYDFISLIIRLNSLSDFSIKPSFSELSITIMPFFIDLSIMGFIEALERTKLVLDLRHISSLREAILLIKDKDRSRNLLKSLNNYIEKSNLYTEEEILLASVLF